FAHAVPPLRQMVELTRRGTSPTAIMATLRAQAMAQWHGVGLNDRCPCGSGRRARACCWSTRPR
ncbi:MAG: SEC-C metal-binding domain-containing protein, partial [Micrococcales bacterium]|nr:SEC-C metal-binding domain-containing protein [Micrococcales bacterium]